MIRRLIAGIMVAIATTPSAFAQSSDDAVESKGEKEQWKEYCNLVAQSFTMRDAKGNPFKLGEHAVFEHKNPFNRYEVGLVYVWTQKNGRPVALFTDLVRKLPDRDDWIEIWEMHSLHDEPMDNLFLNQRVWVPGKPGLTWKPIPDAPKPATRAATQRIQSKGLLRRFKMDAVVLNERYELRAIPRPVYSYDAKDEDGQVTSGAITFFCRATDPEAFLVLEVRETDEGPKWHYAPGNFTLGPTSLKLDDKVVWKEDSNSRAKFHNPRYQHFGAFLNRPFLLEDGIKGRKAALEAIRDP